MSNQLSLQMFALKSVHLPEKPVRIHSRSKLRKLKKSIIRFGLLAPLLITSLGQIVDGVARFKAAMAAELEFVPAIVVSHLSADEIRVLSLSMNRLQEEVTWDREVVAGEFRYLISVGFELDLTGFDTVEIENYLEIGDPEGNVEDIDASLMERPQVSQRGDVWAFNVGKMRHSIACGDSRNIELVEKLFGEDLAAACVTDPPYNVRIRGNVSGTGKHKEFAIASGEMTSAEFQIFLENCLVIIFSRLQQNGVAFVCMDWRHVRHLLNAGESRNFELINIVVWTKSNPGMGSFYRSQHELIVVFKRKGQSHRNNIELGRHGRSRSNVWPYRGVNVFGPERHLLDLHPTVKPSAMVADAIRDVTLPGEIIFDPFLGSGTTLIAAERTHRRCLAIEIEPKYVDLSIRRWQLETGQSAIRLSDGVSFNDAEELAIKANLTDRSERS